MMAQLLPRLAPIIRRLSTNFGGERLGCITAIERVLSSAQLGFVDLADYLAGLPPPEPRPSAKHGPKREPVPNVVFDGLRMVVESEFATEREFDIASSLLRQAHERAGLTRRQIELAAAIVQRVRERTGGGA